MNFKEVMTMNEKHQKSFTTVKSYRPFHSRYDPCKPIGVKYYSTPPNLFLGFQPPNLQQFSAKEALKKGTLWRFFYDYYENPYEKKGR
jgi:spore coat protein JA